MGIAYLPENYKQSTNTTVEGIAVTGQVSPKGTVEHTEHWDGRIDATAKPAAFGLGLTPKSDGPLNPDHVKAVAELTKATQEARLAKASGDPRWINNATRRFEQAKQRVMDTQ